MFKHAKLKHKHLMYDDCNGTRKKRKIFFENKKIGKSSSHLMLFDKNALKQAHPKKKIHTIIMIIKEDSSLKPYINSHRDESIDSENTCASHNSKI